MLCFFNQCSNHQHFVLVWLVNANFIALTDQNFKLLCRVLIRPHPAIWRLVHGMAVVYLIALTFLLFQVSFLMFNFIFYLYCFVCCNVYLVLYITCAYLHSSIVASLFFVGQHYVLHLDSFSWPLRKTLQLIIVSINSCPLHNLKLLVLLSVKMSLAKNIRRCLPLLIGAEVHYLEKSNMSLSLRTHTRTCKKHGTYMYVCVKGCNSLK